MLIQNQWGLAARPHWETSLPGFTGQPLSF